MFEYIFVLAVAPSSGYISSIALFSDTIYYCPNSRVPTACPLNKRVQFAITNQNIKIHKRIGKNREISQIYYE